MTYTDSALITALRDRVAADCPWPVFIGPYSLGGQEGVALTVIPGDEDDDTGNVGVEVQAHIRLPKGSGVPAVLDEARRIKGVVVALTQTVVETVPVTLAWRERASPVLFDSLGRPERFDTYRILSDQAPAR